MFAFAVSGFVLDEHVTVGRECFTGRAADRRREPGLAQDIAEQLACVAASDGRHERDMPG